LRLLQNCRFEQVWNKTIRPSPKIALQGDWKPNDELHAVLVHCDTWTPRFTGLRGNIVPLGSVAPGADHRAARHFQEGVVHYNELLILEKPPEMSKRKRKKDGEDDKPDATPHYRLMFSLYRRDALPAFAVGADEPTTDGKHLTFCMAPAECAPRARTSTTPYHPCRTTTPHHHGRMAYCTTARRHAAAASMGWRHRAAAALRGTRSAEDPCTHRSPPLLLAAAHLLR
jgi:hypothetical protein